MNIGLFRETCLHFLNVKENTGFDLGAKTFVKTPLYIYIYIYIQAFLVSSGSEFRQVTGFHAAKHIIQCMNHSI